MCVSSWMKNAAVQPKEKIKRENIYFAAGTLTTIITPRRPGLVTVGRPLCVRPILKTNLATNPDSATMCAIWLNKNINSSK